MSPDERTEPDGEPTGSGFRRRPVIGSDGASVPVNGEPVFPGVDSARWAWDGEALPLAHPPALPPLLPEVPPQRDHPVDAPAVRPYVRTGGRTRPRLELSLESLVATQPKIIPYQLPHDEAAVLELCREQSRSIAEVAALHRVPIGVAKILVADLAEAGLVTVHQSFAATGPDLALMERVLGGLRRI
jgi:hypothetical protein